MTQWICNGGCPRSGTTAFLEVFNQHPNIGMFPEYNFFTLIEKFDDIFYKEANTREKGWIGNINAGERPGATVITKDFLKYIPQKELGHQRQLIKSLFEAVFPDKDLKVIGEKLPFYFHHDRELLTERIGPIKYIHITRNPKWVVNSFRHRTKLVEQGKDLWKYNEFAHPFDLWIEAWNFQISKMETHDILPIKYENFFDDPVGARKEVFDFLELDDYPVMNFSGEKYGELNSLSDSDRVYCDTLFPALIENWDNMSMRELMNLEGTMYQSKVDERLNPLKRAMSQ